MGTYTPWNLTGLLTQSQAMRASGPHSGAAGSGPQPRRPALSCAAGPQVTVGGAGAPKDLRPDLFLPPPLRPAPFPPFRRENRPGPWNWEKAAV